MTNGFSRQYFRIETDTGPSDTGDGFTLTVKGDTGPCFSGEIAMIRLKQEGNDTGGIIEIGLYPAVDTGAIGPAGNVITDTGQGWLFVAPAEAGATTWLGGDTGGIHRVFAPVVPITLASTSGSDGTHDTGFAPVVAAGERVRVKVRAGRVVKAGSTNVTNVWVYVRES